MVRGVVRGDIAPLSPLGGRFSAELLVSFLSPSTVYENKRGYEEYNTHSQGL